MPKTTTKTTSSNCDSDNIQLIMRSIMTLDTKIDGIRNDLSVEIGKHVRNEFEKHSEHFTNKIFDVVNHQTNKVNALEIEMENNERIARLNDVIIKGVPTNHKAKLVDVFGAICSTIGFSHSTITSINNMFRLSNTNTQSSPILVQFATQLLKREFMSKYYSHGHLQLKHIGISSESRLYASDNLTKLNNSILQKSLQMVKKKLISKVRVRAGYVYVQSSNGNEFKQIRKEEDLGDLDNDESNGSVCDLSLYMKPR